MLNPSEIKEKIEEVTRKISQLKTSKTESEKKRKKGENLLEQFTTTTKRMLSEIGNLDNQIDSFSDGITDCFSEFYKQEMKSAVKKGKLYDLDSETSSFKSLIKGRIIDLDDIIEDFIQQISKNNDLLNKLKGMLDQAVNVIQDVIPGGK